MRDDAYNIIPEYTLEAIGEYVKYGESGDFLKAVMENNLMEALGRADKNNRAAIFDICLYVYNEIPHTCHGSPEMVKAWQRGRAKERPQEKEV